MRSNKPTRITGTDFEEIYSETVEKLADRENLDKDILDQATDLLEDVPPEVKQHYRPRHMAAASLHIATRMNGTPRTVKQFSDHLKDLNWNNIQGRHLNKTRRCVKKLKTLHSIQPDPVLAEDYLPLLEEKLDLPPGIEERCRDILSEIRELYLASGRSQIAVASAAVYLASKQSSGSETLDPDRLAEVACREKKTIRDNAALFQRKLELEV